MIFSAPRIKYRKWEPKRKPNLGIGVVLRMDRRSGPFFFVFGRKNHRGWVASGIGALPLVEMDFGEHAVFWWSVKKIEPSFSFAPGAGIDAYSG